MLDRIMVATSRTRPQAEPLLKLINNIPIQAAILTHCVESVLPIPSRDQGAVRRAERELEQWVAEVQKLTDVPVQAMVRIGIPAQQIIQAAREQDADTIVVSAFVEMPWQDFFIGSTALDIIRYGHTNMLVLHPPGTNEQIAGGLQRPLLEHVLFPTDFSEYSRVAFEAFSTLADKGLKRVSLVHIQDVTRIAPYLMERLGEFDATDNERLEEMAAQLRERGTEVDCYLELGVPEQGIIKKASELGASCIAIGSRGRTRDEALRWGSVSERVVRRAEMPVLIIKQGQTS